jgi:hypothetical protein
MVCVARAESMCQICILRLSRKYSPIAKAPYEGLRAIGWPILFVVEFARVPDDLVEQLAHANGMRSWARAAGFEATELRIAHMSHMVRTIEIDSIPTCWEADGGHDASWAWVGGEVQGLGISGVDVLQTCEGELSEALGFGFGAGVDVADEHTEALATCKQTCTLCADEAGGGMNLRAEKPGPSMSVESCIDRLACSRQSCRH